jgi:hypothetical protein
VNDFRRESQQQQQLRQQIIDEMVADGADREHLESLGPGELTRLAAISLLCNVDKPITPNAPNNSNTSPKPSSDSSVLPPESHADRRNPLPRPPFRPDGNAAASPCPGIGWIFPRPGKQPRGGDPGRAEGHPRGTQLRWESRHAGKPTASLKPGRQGWAAR